MSLCARAQTSFHEEPTDLGFIDNNKIAYYSQEFGFDLPDSGSLMLYDTLENWLGTPYRFAGNCEKGIDCSGFVNMLYDRVYGKKLGARNSAEIYSQLEKIDIDDIQQGDLVFFRIRKNRISHIGLYLGNHKFVHASSSNGVIISDMNEPYYKKYFAGAGRHKPNTFNMTSQGIIE
ncbi:NlpC/P60 family protein [soil metagenome]